MTIALALIAAMIPAMFVATLALSVIASGRESRLEAERSHIGF